MCVMKIEHFLPTIQCMMKIVIFFTNHICMADEHRLVFPIIVMCVMKIDLYSLLILCVYDENKVVFPTNLSHV